MWVCSMFAFRTKQVEQSAIPQLAETPQLQREGGFLVKKLLDLGPEDLRDAQAIRMQLQVFDEVARSIRLTLVTHGFIQKLLASGDLNIRVLGGILLTLYHFAQTLVSRP